MVCVSTAPSFVFSMLASTTAIHVGMAAVNIVLLWTLLGPLMAASAEVPETPPRWKARGRCFSPRRRLSQRTTWRCRSPGRSVPSSPPNFLRWFRRDLTRIGFFRALYHLVRRWFRYMILPYCRFCKKRGHATRPKATIGQLNELRKHLERKRLHHFKRRVKRTPGQYEPSQLSHGRKEIPDPFSAFHWRRSNKGPKNRTPNSPIGCGQYFDQP